MRALDLFCGLGGWSDGLAMEGFDVLGVEIDREIAKIYKHDVVLADVCTLSGDNFADFDLIVGSPPCRDFCELVRVFGHRWKNPPNIKKSLELVHAFLRIVDEANPPFWVMENVLVLYKYLYLKPTLRFLMKYPNFKRAFWGKFPQFLIPYGKEKYYYRRQNGKLYIRGKGKPKPDCKTLSMLHSKIPLPVARALGRAVRQQLQK